MMAAKKNNQEGDITFPNPPSDGISSLSTNGSPSAASTMVVAGCWDSSLYMYELQYNAGNLSNIVKHSQLPHEAPVLCSDIGPDGMTTFSAGCDGNVRMWNATQAVSTAQIIGNTTPLSDA